MKLEFIRCRIEYLYIFNEIFVESRERSCARAIDVSIYLFFQALCKFLLTEIQDVWDGGPPRESQYSRSSSVSDSRSTSNADLSESVGTISFRFFVNFFVVAIF